MSRKLEGCKNYLHFFFCISFYWFLTLCHGTYMETCLQRTKPKSESKWRRKHLKMDRNDWRSVYHLLDADHTTTDISPQRLLWWGHWLHCSYFRTLIAKDTFWNDRISRRIINGFLHRSICGSNERICNKICLFNFE